MAVFVDASAWVALVHRRDQWHAAATEHLRRLGGRTRLVTSNYVLAEAFTWLRAHRAHAAAVQLNQMVNAAEQIRQLDLAWVTRAVHDLAWDIFEHYGGEDFSFFDCTSFALCRERPIDHVFTFDRDFRTLGFEVRP